MQAQFEGGHGSNAAHLLGIASHQTQVLLSDVARALRYDMKKNRNHLIELHKIVASASVNSKVFRPMPVLADTSPLPHTLDPQGRFALLVSDGWDDYQLIDMGFGRKLERFGQFLVNRPEEQAMNRPLLSEAEWEKADAYFDGDAEETEGRWQFIDKAHQIFPMQVDGLSFHGRFTSFRHMGFFPEQVMHWRFMREQIKAANRPLRVLNLFGYTGIASLIAAQAGAHVTHVDASRRAIHWARENQAQAGLESAPIRWINEDAVKFVERELRRNNRYDGIILDPPKFGRGPNGEVWRLFESLPKHLADCVALLADDAQFLILSAYAIRASFLAIDSLAEPLLRARGGRLQSGELAIRQQNGTALLSTSLFTRWSRT